MIRGVDVTVLRPVAGERDRFGNETRAGHVSAVMPDALLAPGASAGFEASRPEGVRVAFTLHVPKTWTESLEGCEVVVPGTQGGTFRCIADWAPYMDSNTPTRWHGSIELEATHG
jgi:hypothetical protein